MQNISINKEVKKKQTLTKTTLNPFDGRKMTALINS